MTRKKPNIRHAPQRRGRKRTEGAARYKSGKIVPEKITPNAITIEARRMLLGLAEGEVMTPEALRLAENPLGVALHRQWITPAEHRVGEAIALLYQRAGLDLPSLRTQDLSREIRGGASGRGDAKAMTILREVAKSLNGWPKCTAAIIDVCVLSAFPDWMLAHAGMKRTDYGTGRVHLCTGLRLAGRVLGVDTAEERRAA